MQPADPAEFPRPLSLDRISTTQHREEIAATDKERADKALKGIAGKRLTYRRTDRLAA